MSIKAIDFTAEMNLAVLNNYKSRTSRIIKPQPSGGLRQSIFVKSGIEDGHGYEVIPKILPGDVLWIRETWRIGAWDESTQCIAVDYKADDYHRREWIHIDDKTNLDRYVRQTIEDAKKAELRPQPDGSYRWVPGYSPARWRSPRFMPAAVARTFLQVIDVMAQHIQDISDVDILREGILSGPDIRERFIKLWDGIYAKKGNGWTENRFVWVYTFQRTQRPADWPGIGRQI